MQNTPAPSPPTTSTNLLAHVMVEGERDSRWINLWNPQCVDQAISALTHYTGGKPLKILAVKEQSSGLSPA